VALRGRFHGSGLPTRQPAAEEFTGLKTEFYAFPRALTQRFEAGDGRDRLPVELVDSGAGGLAAVAHQGRLVDGVLGKKGVLVGLELGPQVIGVGDELAAQFVDQIEQSMAVEVGPDEAAGDAALVAGEGAGIGGAQGVDGSLLAGDAVGGFGGAGEPFYS